jgi:hypothetical protein
VDKLAEKLTGVLSASLADGEELLGALAASEQKGFFGGGHMVAIGVTRDRLLIQRLTRKWEPDGEPLALRPEEIASAKAGGAAGSSPEVGAAIMNSAAAKLELETTSGEKRKFSFMRGTGPLGGLGGGETQRQGVEAVAAFFAAAEK